MGESDHRPLLLKTSSSFKAKNSFKFDKRWPENTNISEIISKTWNLPIEGTHQFKVSRRANNWLLRPVSYEEVKEATFSINSESAPGTDGFTGAFFRHYWSLINQDVVAAVASFFRCKKLLRPFNDTIIALTPKSKSTVDMSNIRPISICNVYYKICSKILVKRMQRIMNKLISANQSAFIQGRLI
ncbi:hypothetical protein Cni_G06277 [Canna indica]|uniref:Reverse transcriptase domain-containing protein n=1 Tax=Canna indica TaxID=4628 RepID=A0AAQ3Q6D0_9LILI|nr:hypothetical protein Cni_G06277 [Canna indica]